MEMILRQHRWYQLRSIALFCAALLTAVVLLTSPQETGSNWSVMWIANRNFGSTKNFRFLQHEIFSLTPLNISQYPRRPPYVSGMRSACLAFDDSGVALEGVSYQDLTEAQKQSVYCLPAFMILGFTKCGTTLLYHRLSAIPRMRTRTKETHFWENGLKAAGKWDTLGLYMSLFRTNVTSSPDQQMFSDATPRYMYSDIRGLDPALRHDSIAQNVAKFFPNSTRFLVIVRDPVARLVSDFNFFYKATDSSKTTSKLFHNLVQTAITNYKYCHDHNLFHANGYLAGECTVATVTYTDEQYNICEQRNKVIDTCRSWLTKPETRLAVGTYSVYIKHWLKYHSREQFLFLQLEDFSAASTATLVDTVLPFLGVRLEATELLLLHKQAKRAIINPSKRSFTMFNETRKMLEDFYRPYNRELSQLLQDEKYMFV